MLTVEELNDKWRGKTVDVEMPCPYCEGTGTTDLDKIEKCLICGARGSIGGIFPNCWFEDDGDMILCVGDEGLAQAIYDDTIIKEVET